MTISRSFFVAFLGLGLWTGAGMAESPCAFGAFVRPDVVGAPVVVDAPADGAAHLGAMPVINDPERGMMGAVAMVTDVKNGFAAVSQVAPWGQPVTELEGWVSARDLAFVAQTSRGFAEPDPTSAVLWQGESGLMPDMIAGIVECKGVWVALELADATAKAPVWVRGICTGQGAACDGVKGD